MAMNRNLPRLNKNNGDLFTYSLGFIRLKKVDSLTALVFMPSKLQSETVNVL